MAKLLNVDMDFVGDWIMGSSELMGGELVRNI